MSTGICSLVIKSVFNYLSSYNLDWETQVDSQEWDKYLFKNFFLNYDTILAVQTQPKLSATKTCHHHRA